MSDPSLADVITRLDRLEALLGQLVELVRAGASSSPARTQPAAAAPPPSVISVAPPAVSPAGQRGEPPVIQVAPPRSGSGASPASASAPAAAAPAAAMVMAPTGTPEGAHPANYDPFAHRTDIQVPGPSGTIQQVLTRIFEAGLMPEPEDTWAIMTKLTHPSQMVGPRALDHFKAFNWHKLRRTATTYLRNGDPSSYVVVYTDPPEITADVDRVRAYIKAGNNRMPVPVGFARDATQGNAWRVTMLSL